MFELDHKTFCERLIEQNKNIAVGQCDCQLTQFSRHRFLGKNLFMFDFKNCDFSESIFSNCDISQSFFIECNLENAMFINCNFEGVQIENSGIEKCQFVDCNMTNAMFNGLDGNDFNFKRCDMRHSKIFNLIGLDGAFIDCITKNMELDISESHDIQIINNLDLARA